MKHTLITIFLAISTLAVAKDKEAMPRTVTTAKGDVITLSPVKQRGATINDQICKDIAVSEDKPILLNGNPIFCHKDHPDLQPNIELQRIAVADYRRLTNAIDAALVNEKEQLPPGYYELKLNNMVVSDKGYITYYREQGLSAKKIETTAQKDDKNRNTSFYSSKTMKNVDVPQELISTIEKKIRQVLDNYQYTPFIYKDQPVAYLSSYTYSFQNQLKQ